MRSRSAGRLDGLGGLAVYRLPPPLGVGETAGQCWRLLLLRRRTAGSRARGSKEEAFVHSGFLCALLAQIGLSGFVVVQHPQMQRATAFTVTFSLSKAGAELLRFCSTDEAPQRSLSSDSWLL